MKTKNEMKNDVKNLFEEGKDKAQNEYQEMKEKAGSITHQIQEKVNHVMEDGKEKVSQAQDMLCNYSDVLVKKIKEEPIISVLIAAGIGYVFSKLFKK